MIHSIKGQISAKGDNFFVLDCGGVGFKIFSNRETVLKLPAAGTEAKAYCFLYVREDQLDLYGFLEEGALKLFQMLNNVSGVGPKTALNVLDLDSVPNIMAAIIERRAELLTRTSGIGKKTAERIILELQSRIKLPGARALTEKMGLDMEVEEALVGLGYPRYEVKKVLNALEGGTDSLENRLKLALKALGRKG